MNADHPRLHRAGLDSPQWVIGQTGLVLRKDLKGSEPWAVGAYTPSAKQWIEQRGLNHARFGRRIDALQAVCAQLAIESPAPLEPAPLQLLKSGPGRYRDPSGRVQTERQPDGHWEVYVDGRRLAHPLRSLPAVAEISARELQERSQ